LEGAESCIHTQDLAQAVEKRLARKVFVSASEADVSVEGHVEGKPGKWRAVITIREADGKLLGTRELDSAESECSALNEPLVFVVSVLIDPDAETREPVEEPAKPPPVTPTAPPPRVVVRTERVLVPVEKKPDPWFVEAGLGGAIGLGLLPGTAFGVTTSAVLEPPAFWGIFVTGSYWFQRSVTAQNGAKSDVSLAHAGAGLCPIYWGADRVSYRLCAGFLIGSLQSKGVGFDTEKSDEKLSAHVLVPNRLGLRLGGPLALTAGVSLFVPLVRTELTYRTSDGVSHSLYDPSPVAGAVDLGVALFFP
jgi:hypothetical protein